MYTLHFCSGTAFLRVLSYKHTFLQLMFSILHKNILYTGILKLWSYISRIPATRQLELIVKQLIKPRIMATENSIKYR